MQMSEISATKVQRFWPQSTEKRPRKYGLKYSPVCVNGSRTKKYDFILNKGQQEYEESIKGKKKISYSNDERLLLKRLREFKNEHLRFITDFDAPFDNNQAERDLRGFKTKTKVSGCFRSDKGIVSFTKIYSLISTLKKQNQNIYKNILDIFGGKELTFT